MCDLIDKIYMEMNCICFCFPLSNDYAQQFSAGEKATWLSSEFRSVTVVNFTQ